MRITALRFRSKVTGEATCTWDLQLMSQCDDCSGSVPQNFRFKVLCDTATVMSRCVANHLADDLFIHSLDAILSYVAGILFVY